MGWRFSKRLTEDQKKTSLAAYVIDLTPNYESVLYSDDGGTDHMQ